MSDVRQSIPLAAFLRVVVIQHIVVRKRTQGMNSVRHGVAAKQRRLGETDLGVQTKNFSGLNQACRFHQRRGRQEIQASEFVVFAEHAPGSSGRGAWFDWQLVIGWKFVEVHRANSIMRRDSGGDHANRP